MSGKTLLFEQFARVAKALASANRLGLLEALAQGERSVEVLAKATGMSVANTSHHLQVLKDAGLAVSRKEGLQVFYRLSDDQVVGLLGCLRQVAEKHLADERRNLAPVGCALPGKSPRDVVRFAASFLPSGEQVLSEASVREMIRDQTRSARLWPKAMTLS